MNLKPEKMLIVTPPFELHFVGPFTRPCVTTLKMKNPTDQMLLFKIKTTAPKRYCVRPNFGAIRPDQTSTVEICLQPFTYDPNEKNKHKFMVQSMVAPSSTDDPDELNKLWKEAEQTGQLMDVKLRCVFEMPAAEPTAQENSTAPVSALENVKKQSPKVASQKEFDKIMQVDRSESIVDELRLLREQNDLLKEDNLKLKDQLSRVLLNPKKDNRVDEPYTPQFVEKQIPMFYIAIAIAAVIFGLLLGKFLL